MCCRDGRPKEGHTWKAVTIGDSLKFREKERVKGEGWTEGGARERKRNKMTG